MNKGGRDEMSDKAREFANEITRDNPLYCVNEYCNFIQDDIYAFANAYADEQTKVLREKLKEQYKLTEVILGLIKYTKHHGFCNYDTTSICSCGLLALIYTTDTSNQGQKLPIDRPCSACSAGDTKMMYHLHYPPFRKE